MGMSAMTTSPDAATSEPGAVTSATDSPTPAGESSAAAPSSALSSIPGVTESEAGDRVEIAIDNFAFSLAELSVPAGTTIVFTNEDDVVHVLSEGGQLQSPDLAAGDSYEVTLDQPGTIPYICNIHQYMRVSIRVTA